jgi:hypothetical protein
MIVCQRLGRVNGALNVGIYTKGLKDVYHVKLELIPNIHLVILALENVIVVNQCLTVNIKCVLHVIRKLNANILKGYINMLSNNI